MALSFADKKLPSISASAFAWHVHARCYSLCLSALGRRRSTRACRARTPCCVGCGQSMPYERRLHQREASLIRFNAVVRRAEAVFRTACARTALAVSREAAQHANFRARAPCRTGCGRAISLWKGAALELWSRRALATGTAWAGLCLIHRPPAL